MFCRNCGNQMADGATFCTKCGTPAVQTPPQQNAYAQPNYAQPNYAQPNYAQPNYVQPQRNPLDGRGMSIAALVLGICGAVFGICSIALDYLIMSGAFDAFLEQILGELEPPTGPSGGAGGMM